MIDFTVKKYNRKIITTSQFKKDYKLVSRQNNFNESSLINTISIIANNLEFSKNCYQHSMVRSGTYKKYKNVHITPDLILIYEVTSTEVKLVRLASHSQLNSCGNSGFKHRKNF